MIYVMGLGTNGCDNCNNWGLDMSIILVNEKLALRIGIISELKDIMSNMSAECHIE